MRVLIFGAGALGSVIGGLLSKGHEVHLVTRPGHAQAIRERGLRIEGVLNGVFSLATHIDMEDVPQPDAIFVTVKAYDTKVALEALAPMARGARMVVSLQNGLTNLELFRAALPDKAVMGVTSMGATLVGPGLVRYAGKGDTLFGHLENSAELSREAADLFIKAGLAARSDANIERELWMKGIINASINPLTAILGCPNGELLEDEEVLAISHLACREGVAVAEGIGMRMPPGKPLHKGEGGHEDDRSEPLIHAAGPRARKAHGDRRDKRRDRETGRTAGNHGPGEPDPVGADKRLGEASAIEPCAQWKAFASLQRSFSFRHPATSPLECKSLRLEVRFLIL